MAELSAPTVEIIPTHLEIKICKVKTDEQIIWKTAY